MTNSILKSFTQEERRCLSKVMNDARLLIDSGAGRDEVYEVVVRSLKNFSARAVVLAAIIAGEMLAAAEPKRVAA